MANRVVVTRYRGWKKHMKNEQPDYQMIKLVSIFSTATGYDIVVRKISREFGLRTQRVYRNVSSHTMRRFYFLSNSDIDIQQDCKIGWQRHQRLFPAPKW